MKKELTIYDVQVNCARLSKEKIKNLARIVNENGGAILDDEVALTHHDIHIYFRIDNEGLGFAVWRKSKYKQSISYARFVEMFDKKGLEVNKWYKHSYVTQFIFRQNDDDNCGISDGVWVDNYFQCSDSNVWTLATEQEVSTILFAEAKNRLGKDWENAKIKAHANGNECKNNGGFDVFYYIFGDILWNRNGIIYEKGKWSELLVGDELTQFTNQQMEAIKSMESNVDVITIENPSQETKDMCMELRKDKEEEKTRIREKLNKPTHYKTKSGYDAIDIAQDNNLNFNLGAVCKYVLRAGKKLYPNMNGTQSYLADLKKAQDHLNREIEYTEKQMSDEKA